MKKGAIHLDWVISIGIFLIYILFFFIFITPFYINPTQEGDITLNLLEDNFRNEVYWSITKMPIFIDCSSCGDSTSIEDICLPSFPFEWSQEEIRLIDNQDSLIGFEKNENCGNDGLSTTQGNTITDLTLNHIFSNGINIVWIIYNKEGFIYMSNPIWTCINENPETGQCNFLQYKDDGTKDYVYYYGLAEKIFGISENKLSNLNDPNIKENWNFPTNADFQISITYISGDKEGQNVIPTIKTAEPYEQANVYVREWTDFILNEIGEKEAVKINIAIWR